MSKTYKKKCLSFIEKFRVINDCKKGAEISKKKYECRRPQINEILKNEEVHQKT